MIRRISTELYTEAAYAVYSDCMYKPDYQKYLQHISEPDILCFGAFHEGELSGILIIKEGEILGIAVHQRVRGHGLGRSLIAHAAQHFSTLSAETDDDSVGFYRSCGFECTRFERVFPDGISVRYKCIRKSF